MNQKLDSHCFTGANPKYFGPWKIRWYFFKDIAFRKPPCPLGNHNDPIMLFMPTLLNDTHKSDAKTINERIFFLS